jgi:hypothetical protein
LFDPHDPKKLQKLRKAVTNSLCELEIFRENRMAAYRQFVGAHYSNDGTADKVPINLVKLAAEVVARNLAATTPRALVTANRRDLKAVANAFSLALNKVLEWTRIEEDLQTWVFEAIFSPFGILKVSLDVAEYVEIDGEAIAAGRPKVEPVLFHDWVHDMSASNLRNCAFYGHRFLMDKEEARENPLFDASGKEYLQTFKDRGWDKEGDTDTQTLSRQKNPFGEDYRDMVELWELYLPLEQLVVTIPHLDYQGPPLRVVEWTGPEEGPYHFLYFTPVPGNTTPLPPVSMWRDLHELANALFNKLGRQAERQKTVGVAPSSMQQDVTRLMDAADGQVITGDIVTSQQFGEVKTGGIDESNNNFFRQVRDLFNWQAGNIEALAGLAPQSGTLGQDQMLSQSASHLIQGMQDKVKYAAASVMKSAGWFLWHDPAGEVPIEFRVQGSQETQPALWTPERRNGDWYDYAISIEPFSMRSKSPEEQLTFVMDFFDRLGAMLPVMQQQGVVPNIEAMIKLVAQLTNLPQLLDLVIFTQGQLEPTGEPTSMPSTTTRKYERVSRSAGPTNRGQANMSQPAPAPRPPMMSKMGG